MEYNYKLTAGETAGCGVRLAGRWLAGKKRAFLGTVLVLAGVLVINGLAEESVVNVLFVGRLVLLVLAVWLGALLWQAARQASAVSRRWRKEERRLLVEGGLLTLAGSRDVFRYRCREMGRVKRNGRVYWLELSGNDGGRRWLFLPVRVLGGPAKQEAFLEFLEEQRKLPGELPDELGRSEKAGSPVADRGASDDRTGECESTGPSGYRNRTAGFEFCQNWTLETLTMVTAQRDWIRRRYLTKWKKKRYLLPAAAAVAVTAGFLVLGGELRREYGGIVAGLAAYVLLRMIRGYQAQGLTPLPLLREGLRRLGPEVYGSFRQIQIGDRGIWKKSAWAEVFWTWEDLGWVLETENWFFLCTKKEEPVICLGKERLGDWMGQKLFLQDCGSKGLTYARIQPQMLVFTGERERRESTADHWHREMGGRDFGGPGNGTLLVAFAAMAAIFLLAVFLPEYGRGYYAGDDGIGLEVDLDGGASEEFHKELYENYMPLEEQVQVLEETGFSVPEEIVERFQKAMEEDQSSRVWIEGYPFCALLTEIGMPERDFEAKSWQVTRYPKEAFWFDWEAMDIAEAYEEILEGIHVMAGDTCSVTDVEVDLAEADWETGIGRVTVRYRLNGTPQEHPLNFQHDWLDPLLFEYVNRSLKACGVTKRIYMMDDSGQGCILFFRDSAWAKEFTKKTGIPLQ